MTTMQRLMSGGVLVVGSLLAVAVLRSGGPPPPAGDHEDVHDAKVPRGAHGGRLLADGAFTLEVTIFEAGVPPEFRVYASDGATPIALGDIDLTIQLDRLGGRRDRIRFLPAGEYLLGDAAVEEPHSFDVTVEAVRKGLPHTWRYSSYEGRLTMDPRTAERVGVRAAVVGPATIRTTREIMGQIVPNEGRLAHVVPRFAGVVREVRTQLGDHVTRGERLAVVQSNESLQSYDLVTPLDGTIVRKHAIVGEFVAQGDAVFVVADLTTVWVDLAVHRHDFPYLRVGQRVEIDPGDDTAPIAGVIAYVSPLGAPSTQTMLARVELPNPQGTLLPGLFVTSRVVVEEAEVGVAVPATALQTFRDWDVVFVKVGDVYEVRPIELGRRDAEWVEVVHGLAAGDEVVVAQAFVLKADLGKAGATHDH